MITASFLIAFVAAKILRGSKPMFPGPADKTKTPRIVSVIVILVLVAMLVLPAFILYLAGAR